MQDITLNVPDEAWRPVGDDSDVGGIWSRIKLEPALIVNGVPFHLEGTHVENHIEVGGGCTQEAPQHDELLAEIHSCVGAAAPLQTVTVRGQEYVLIASPYSS